MFDICKNFDFWAHAYLSKFLICNIFIFDQISIDEQMSILKELGVLIYGHNIMTLGKKSHISKTNLMKQKYSSSEFVKFVEIVGNLQV